MPLKKIFSYLALSAFSIVSAKALDPERVGVVLQKNEYFSMDWENFKVPADMKLFLITSSNNNNIDPQNSNFEEVIKIEDFTKELIASEIQKILHAFKLTSKDLLLVTHDEYALDIAAELRQEYGIYGSKPNQVLPYRDKAHAKTMLRGSGVRIPTYISYSPQDFLSDTNSYLDKIERIVGYPMFAKPTDEARCADVAKISNRDELLSWAIRHKELNNYEIEEFVNGQLYTSICIIQGGQIVHHGAHKFLYPCFEFMNSKKPLGGHSLRNDDPEVIELKRLSNIILGVFPIEDAVIHIEMMKNQSGEFVFIEAAARQPGGYISDLYYKKSDIHLGKTNFMLQLGLPVQIQEQNHMFAGWYWPHKPVGTILAKSLPKMKSKYKAEWRVEPQSRYEGSQFLGDSAVRLLLWNADYDDLIKDLYYLENYYNPVTFN